MDNSIDESLMLCLVSKANWRSKHHPHGISDKSHHFHGISTNVINFSCITVFQSLGMLSLRIFWSIWTLEVLVISAERVSRFPVSCLISADEKNPSKRSSIYSMGKWQNEQRGRHWSKYTCIEFFFVKCTSMDCVQMIVWWHKYRYWLCYQWRY